MLKRVQEMKEPKIFSKIKIKKRGRSNNEWKIPLHGFKIRSHGIALALPQQQQ